MKGQRIEFKAVIGLVVDAIQALPGGTGDVFLLADRLGDGTGVTVTLRVDPIPGDRGKSIDFAVSVLADDLRDAVHISDDPFLTSLDGYTKPFESLRDALKTLADLDPEELTPAQRELLEQDISTARDDLQEVADIPPRVILRKSGFPSLRISPFLRVKAAG